VESWKYDGRFNLVFRLLVYLFFYFSFGGVMKTLGHTAGPWRVYGHGDVKAGGSRSVLSTALGGNIVAECPYQGPNSAESNARLIACAPELLEALEGLLADKVDSQEKARSVISKAKGES
jgi:hypothetical protein